MKFKLIYLICMILCVFLTFSTVNATDLNDASVVCDSQSESSFTNLNEDISNDIVKNNEDEDCVESMNGLFSLNTDLNYDESESDKINNHKSSLSSINSDENSLKSTLSPSGNTFKSIQDSIDSAKSGDTINLNGKTYTGNGNLIVVNKTLTISGGQGSQKATLDAKKLSGILKITAANVKLINCNFINSNDRAVAVLNNNCSISSCDFNHNFATSASHLRVLPNCTNFLVENSNFLNGNCLEYSNVGLRADRTTVRNCTFVNNTATNDYAGPITGAALQIGQNDTQINRGSVINCSFINNTAKSAPNATHGGALCFRPGIKLINTTFINNYCDGIGGATTLHSDGELLNCIFINNSAGRYGGAICTGLSTDDISVNVSSCIFENNSAPMGGAIEVKGNNIKIVNSTFSNNIARDDNGGALYIIGNDALVVNSTFDRNVAKNIGAGIYLKGNDVSILNSSFDANMANSGGAIYIVGSNASLFSSNFTNHDLINGAVYIMGPNTYVYDSNFINNHAENGAAIYIKGSDSNLIFNNFTSNNVSKRGGAVFIEGSNANLIASNFLNNSAIPNESDIVSGLGGAIYIKGDNNTIDSSNFTFNTARNGSAIYTDGSKMTLSNTSFDKNQAWSYVLDSFVNPAISYFNESDISINFTLIGGNNIANAIYNTASTEEIYFYNVSYVSSKGPKTTGDDEIHPVNGAQNSNNGTLLYQDDREDNQLVNVIIYKDSEGTEENPLGVNSFVEDHPLGVNSLDDENHLASPSDSINSQEIIVNKTFNTGILGDISFNISDFIDEPLYTGNYIVFAKHYEDDYYKEIDTENQFAIIPIVDLAINISSSRVNIDFNKTVKFTIKVDNYGPSNATGTEVKAIIPDGLIYLSSTPSTGSYDANTGIWTIGDLNLGDNQTLVINVLTNKTGIIDYPVNISSNEDDSNEKNNFNNKTIRVLCADLSIDVQALEDELNFGDNVDWIITVKNNGPNNASKLVVSILPFEDDLIYLNSSNENFNGSSFVLEIPSLPVDEEISFMISTKVNASNKEIDLSANVSSDTYDPIMSNNIDSDSVNILPLCDLIIKVNVSEALVDYGDTVDWLVVVSNDGPDDASNVYVSLSDLESLGLLVLDVSNDSFDMDNLEWIIGDLDSGESLSLIISTEVNTSNKKVVLDGTVFTDTFESNKENNRDSDELSIGPICDLIIDIAASDSTVNYGDQIDWIVIVSNDGPDDAEDVIVSLSDLESLGLVIMDVSNDSFDKENNEWIIGNLSSGENVSLSISTIGNKSNVNVTVFSEVKTSTPELDMENNIDSDSVSILPVCDLVISIIPDNSLVNISDVVNWIINVTNIGPDNASDVIVLNSLPEGLDFIFADSSKGELENITDEDGGILDFIWKVGDLANNESAYLVISTNATLEGLIPNNASVNSSTLDLNESNNFDSAILQVIVDDGSNETDNPEDGDEPYEGDDYEDEEYDPDENPDDDYPVDSPSDDFLEKSDKNDNSKNDSDSNDSRVIKSKKQIKQNSKKDILLSNKKTGNPLLFAVISIFALLVFPFRKN